MKTLFRILLGSISLVLLGNSALLWMTANTNLGLILMTAIGFCLLLYALLFDFINRILDNKVGAWIKGIIFVGLVAFTFTVTMITISATTDTVTYQEDALIVLGAGIHGDRVSLPLAHRLDAAVKYHKMNPNALIIVSGGQGPQETITEAEAMRYYLTEHGVNPAVIVKEDRATSTLENFKFSKEILDERFLHNYQVAYTTNHFHLYRASRLAKNAGLSVTRMRAESNIYSLIPDYIRESCAVMVMWLTGK